MWKKQNFARAIRIQKENLIGVTTHLSEIIELTFEKKNCHTFFVF